MNIVIPCAGKGSRFKEAGYTKPKLLISVLGKPLLFWVIDSLNILQDDTLYLAYHNLGDHNFEDLVRFNYPDLDIQFVKLPYSTRGPADTLYQVATQIDNDKHLLSVDCDTFYGKNENILDRNGWGNRIFYFIDNEDAPIYSYLRIALASNSSYPQVIEIAEKRKISDFASVGAYKFKDAKTYCKNFKQIDQTKEIYLSSVYHKMIENGQQIDAVKVKDFHCLGTPQQLQMYTVFNPDGGKDFRLCWDLDNTLVSYPTIPGDYSTVKPIWRNINALKFHHARGCYTIIQTARRMKTHKGNVGRIVADIGKVTIDKLEEFGIPYDELVFGKPHADRYIDDLGVNPNTQDISKETGFYPMDVDTRWFNTIKYKGNTVIKKSVDKDTLTGEIYWYKNIPEDLQHLFPKLIDSTEDSLTIERIQGIPFSYLYVNRTLTIKNLEQLIGALADIHISYNDKIPENIYLNYADKLRERVLSYQDHYKFYGFKGWKKTFTDLENWLSNIYAKDDLGIPTIIHGDPVFSNVLLDQSGKIKLIDMRGKLGNELTRMGDIFYDLAKVYQSLLGYDYILHDREIDQDYIKPFIEYFEKCVKRVWGKDRMNWIKILTKSLLFSLVPLHKDNPEHIEGFHQLWSTL